MKPKILIATGIGALALVSPAAAVESPPTGISPSDFATKYSGCLGQLRSKIAQGDFAGIGPFGEHFTGLVNPGAHQGTVGEEEFLEIVIGIPEAELAAFCATQSPGLRSVDSPSSSADVGGLMPSMASWRGSASGSANRPAAGATSRSRQLKL